MRPFEHPVMFGARLGVGEGNVPVAELVAWCEPCRWRSSTPASVGRERLESVALSHSGFRQCQAPTCRAWIADAITDKGQTTPVDTQPDQAGNQALRLDKTGSKPVFRVRYLKGGGELAAGEVRVMTHFATCTEPERFRKDPR